MNRSPALPRCSHLAVGPSAAPRPPFRPPAPPPPSSAGLRQARGATDLRLFLPLFAGFPFSRPQLLGWELNCAFCMEMSREERGLFCPGLKCSEVFTTSAIVFCVCAVLLGVIFSRPFFFFLFFFFLFFFKTRCSAL